MLQEVQKYLDLANLTGSGLGSAADFDSAFQENRLAADVELKNTQGFEASVSLDPHSPPSALNYHCVETAVGLEAELTQQLLEVQRQNFELKKTIEFLKFESEGAKSSKRSAVPKPQAGVPLPEDKTDVFHLWNTKVSGNKSAEQRGASGGDNRYGGSHHQVSRPAWGSPLKHPGNQNKPPLSSATTSASPDKLGASRGKSSRLRIHGTDIPNIPPAATGRKPYTRPMQAHRLMERRREWLERLHEEAGRSCFEGVPFTQGSAAGQHASTMEKESAGMLLNTEASNQMQTLLQKGAAQLMQMAEELGRRKDAETDNQGLRVEVEQLRSECQQLRTQAQRGAHIQERHHDLVWEMQHLRQAHEEENMRLRQKLEQLEAAKNMAMVQVEEAAIMKHDLEEYERQIQKLESEKLNWGGAALEGQNTTNPNISADMLAKDMTHTIVAMAQPTSYVHHSPHQLPAVQFEGEHVDGW
jgi:hypothetical protein